MIVLKDHLNCSGDSKKTGIIVNNILSPEYERKIAETAIAQFSPLFFFFIEKPKLPAQNVIINIFCILIRQRGFCDEGFGAQLQQVSDIRS
jgi:hypothetical protein